MSVVQGYVRVGAPTSKDAPYPKKLSEEQIQQIIDEGLSVLLQSEDDVVVLQQYKDLAALIRRDLRRIAPMSNVNLSVFSEYIRSRLLDAAILTHDRVGLKSAAATTADLAQQVISEKRGGSGKESGLSMISQFDELMSISPNRKLYMVWLYPNQTLTRDELDLLKRDMIGVRLGDLIISARVVQYQNDWPSWYKYVDKKPMNGYHYELQLDTVRMNSRGVLMSQVRTTIEGSFDQKTRSQMSVVTSPYAEGRVDIFFTQNTDDIRTVSVLGNQGVYMKRDSLYVKGIEGVEWITERKVTLNACVLETELLTDGRYVTYYSLVPALKVGMGARHFYSWLDGSGLDYTIDTEEQAFYTTTDPRPTLAAYKPEESRLEIEYSGKDIDSFFLDKRFDNSRVMTNDFYANQKRLGISGARQLHGFEFFNLLKNIVPNMDVRHIDLISDEMSSTGVLTGISVKGSEQRGADAISRISFRHAERIIREEAAFALETPNTTLASIHYTGNPGVLTGAALWRSVPNPIAGAIGASASEEYVVSLQGTRIPRPTDSSEQVIQKAREARKNPEPITPKRPSLARTQRTDRRVPTAVVRRTIVASSSTDSQ